MQTVETSDQQRPGAMTTPSTRFWTATRIYYGALLVSLLFHFRHIFRLPVLLTWDGYLYVDLANVLGTSRFPQDWDFLRTPLFPLSLKMAFAVFEEATMAVLVVQSLFGMLGIWAVTGAIKRDGQPVAAACCAIALTFYPTLVTYEHAVLSEVGTFFFMAVLLNVLLWRPEKTEWKTATLTLVLIAGFYYRPTFLSLTPVVVALHVASLATSPLVQGTEGLKGRAFGFKKATVHGLLVLAVTVGAAQFWNQLPRWKERAGGQFLYGMIRSAAFSPTDPIWEGSPSYRKSVEESLSHGRLPFAGLINGKEYAIFSSIEGRSAEGERIFLSTVAGNPVRYLGAVSRCLVALSGLDPAHSENRLFRSLVMSRDPGSSPILPGPERMSPLASQFVQDLGPSRIAELLHWLGPIYDSVVSVSFLLAVGVLALSVARWDLLGLTWTVVPLQFWALHAAILNPIDRMAVPCYPLMIGFLFAVLPRVFTLRARSQGSL